MTEIPQMVADFSLTLRRIGLSVNPTRSTRPAIFAGKAYIDQLWFFWAAPVAGAVVAGIVGRALFRKPD